MANRCWWSVPPACHQQAAGLEERLPPYGDSPRPTTPPRGRGKRQIADEATLVETIDRVLQDQRVDGLLSVTWEKQVEQTTNTWVEVDAVHREKRVVRKALYHITRISRQKDTIANHCQRFGWKAFCFIMRGQKRRSLQEAVLCYHSEIPRGTHLPTASRPGP